MSTRTNLLIASAVLAAARSSAFAQAVDYHLERVTGIVNQPTFLSQAPGDPANIVYYTSRISSANSGFGVNNTMGTLMQLNLLTGASTPVFTVTNADGSPRAVTQDNGLQTFAFHPDFRTLGAEGYGKVYVSSAQQGPTSLNRVEEYRILDNAGALLNQAGIIATQRTILQYSNAAGNNHTVDWIGFDPTATGSAKNYLHVVTGDGAFGNAYNNASGTNGRSSQNPADIKGKILRIDIAPSSGDAYPADPLKNFAIPTTNPIVQYNTANPGQPIVGPGGAAALGEVWATGVRNGYRASFDRATGDLWHGDVGENSIEEVNFIRAGSNVMGPPADFGWPQREGLPASGINGAPITVVNPFTGVTSTNPILTYNHNVGNAAIGGYVYRGPVASLQGKYFFSDFVSGRIWQLDGFDRNTDPSTFNGQNANARQIHPLWNALIIDALGGSYNSNVSLGSLNGLDHIVSFSEDNQGNLYLIDFGFGTSFDGQYTANAGEIFKIVPGALNVPATAVWHGVLSNSWNTLSGSSTNFNTSTTSDVNTFALPGYASNVVFATSVPSPGNFATVLNRDFFINSLTVKAGTPPVSVANGTSGTATLVILGQEGVTVEPGANGLTLGNVQLGSVQNWTNQNPFAIFINGRLDGPGGINLNGTLALTGSGIINFQGPMTFAPNSKLLMVGGTTHSIGPVTAGPSVIIENSTQSTLVNTIEFNSTEPSVFDGIIRDGSSGRVGFRLHGGTTFNPGGTLTFTGPLTVRFGKLILDNQDSIGGGSGSIIVGDTANLLGVLEINGVPVTGATGTGSVQVGAGQSAGVLTLNSGVLTASNEAWVSTADGGYGNLIINGGTVTTSSWLAIARGGGRGILNMNGGELLVNSQALTVGSFGGAVSALHAVASFRGGQTTVARTLFISESSSAVVNVMGNARIEVNGTTALNGGTGVAFNGTAAPNGVVGILNLIGGTLTTTKLMKTNTTANGATSLLNFHGGTLRAAATPAGGDFISGSNLNAYVYSGGGTIDDNGNNLTLAVPLLPPTGQGVSAVSLPPVAPGFPFSGEPFLTLSGGGGTGATANANIDANGNITGVTITNPGTGYTAAPTVTLFGGGGLLSSTASSATLTTNAAAGALTKAGSGTLTITALATYGGPLSIAGGRVILDTNSASPNSVGVISGAGSLQVNGGAVLTSDGVRVGGAWTLFGAQTIRPNGGTAGASRAGSLAIGGAANAWTGKLDLTDNALILTAASSAAQTALIAQLNNQIASGRAGGAWTGNGITSSTLATLNPNLYTLALADAGDLGLTEYRGQTGLDANATVVVLARFGDASLDGVVDAFDLNVLAGHWQQASGALWSAGDFTGDGIVDAFDLNVLAANWQFGVGSFQQALVSANIPEPASLALLGLGAAFLRGRRRRAC